MRIDAGIIGGTGIGERIELLPGEAIHVPTAQGMARGRIVEVDGQRVLALSRHAHGHKVPPHRVNYAAMALAMRELAARACFSTAAVGSLRPEWGPGALVVCHDFLDLSGRRTTLFDDEVVHTDFRVPFPARHHLIDSAGQLGQHVQDGGVYICTNGPRYETPHEITVYRQLGGDVVGMTAATEAIVMREAGVDYGCLAVVTNLACGLTDSPLSHGEVTAEMKRSGERALQIVLAAASQV